MDYDYYQYCENHFKDDSRMITKKIRTKKFISSGSLRQEVAGFSSNSE